MHAAQFTTAEAARTAILAGNATITLVSKKTGSRYTYRIRAGKRGDVSFVSLLVGPANTSDYRYIGIIPTGSKAFKTTAKTAIPSSAPVVGFGWAFAHVANGSLPDSIEVWHEGRCCRCGRKLTVPSSIAIGLGPECAEMN